MKNTEYFTILDIIKKSTDFFRSKGIPSPKTDAEWITSHVMNKSKLELYMSYNDLVSTEHLNIIRELVIQRGRRRPLQHILKCVDFYNINIKCDHRALIPRSETEVLVDKICNKFEESYEGHIVDFGTGCGAIILSLCKFFNNARGTGLDCSQNALELAHENKSKTNIESVEFNKYNWLSEIYKWPKADLLVSNPPYLDENEWSQSEPEVKDHDPKCALVSKESGLQDLFVIIEKGKDILNNKGMIALEIGHNQAKDVEKKLLTDYCNVVIEKDFSGTKRYVFAERH